MLFSRHDLLSRFRLIVIRKLRNYRLHIVLRNYILCISAHICELNKWKKWKMNSVTLNLAINHFEFKRFVLKWFDDLWWFNVKYLTIMLKLLLFKLSYLYIICFMLCNMKDITKHIWKWWIILLFVLLHVYIIDDDCVYTIEINMVYS